MSASIRSQRAVSRTISTPVARHGELPIAHRRATHKTNMLERLFGKERRRKRRSLYTPSASAPRSSVRAGPSKDMVLTQFELTQLERLRERPNGRHAEGTAPIVQSASRSRISSKART